MRYNEVFPPSNPFCYVLEEPELLTSDISYILVMLFSYIETAQNMPLLLNCFGAPS